MWIAPLCLVLAAFLNAPGAGECFDARIQLTALVITIVGVLNIIWLLQCFESWENIVNSVRIHAPSHPEAQKGICQGAAWVIWCWQQRTKQAKHLDWEWLLVFPTADGMLALLTLTHEWEQGGLRPQAGGENLSHSSTRHGCYQKLFCPTGTIFQVPQALSCSHGSREQCVDLSQFWFSSFSILLFLSGLGLFPPLSVSQRSVVPWPGSEMGNGVFVYNNNNNNNNNNNKDFIRFTVYWAYGVSAIFQVSPCAGQAFTFQSMACGAMPQSHFRWNNCHVECSAMASSMLWLFMALHAETAWCHPPSNPRSTLKLQCTHSSPQHTDHHGRLSTGSRVHGTQCCDA